MQQTPHDDASLLKAYAIHLFLNSHFLFIVVTRTIASEDCDACNRYFDPCLATK
jgi:hypothetical protein